MNPLENFDQVARALNTQAAKWESRYLQEFLLNRMNGLNAKYDCQRRKQEARDYWIELISLLYETNNSDLLDKIDGLEADLESAVRTAYKRGATEWCRLNYPDLYKRFEAEKNANP